MKRTSLIILIIIIIFSSCRNSDWDFPDYDASSVYFAYQSPVRTITLGNDYVNDNTLDNEHKCQIMATVGGFREIRKDIEINFLVDNSLCDDLVNVTAMPTSHYTLSDNKMIILKGSKFLGGVVVQLTDAFFADPLSLTTNYVIPLIITDATNVGGVLRGTPAVTGANRYRPEDWEAAPKDYILYGLKYINNWDANYLRRGTDNVSINGTTTTVKRQGQHTPEDDEIIKLHSLSLTDIEFSMNYLNVDDVSLNMKLIMSFNNNQECVFLDGVWTGSQLVKEYNVNHNIRVFDIVVSGTGSYVKDGEKNSWGNKDRDALYLDYTVEYKVETVLDSGIDLQTVKYVTSDILVIRDRAVSQEHITPLLK